MTTYSTQNPVGSSDPRDLYDNAENLDSLVNGDQAAYNDRLGKSRKSWQAIEDEFAAFIAASGYEFVGDYAAGIEITGYQQVVRDINGEFWRLSGSTALPYTTTGAGMPEGGAFVAVGDASLRQDLGADLVDGKGALLANGAVIYTSTVTELEAISASSLNDGQSTVVENSRFQWDATAQEWNPAGPVSIKAFGAVVDGVTDDMPAFEAARDFLGANRTVVFPEGVTYLGGYRPDLSGVGIMSERGAVVQMDENPNTKELTLLNSLTVQRELDNQVNERPANTRLPAKVLHGIAAAMTNLNTSETSRKEDFTTWNHNIYQVNSGDISSLSGTGTVTADSITWSSSFSANPQVLYPSSFEEGRYYEANFANNQADQSGASGFFVKTNADHIWTIHLTTGTPSLVIIQRDLSGNTLQNLSITGFPNGGAYGWPDSRDVTMGFVVNGSQTTFIINGLPMYRVSDAPTDVGFYFHNNASSSKISAVDPNSTSDYTAKVKKPLSIGAIGDSITYGAWSSLDIEDLLPLFVQNLPGVGDISVTNHAISGSKSGDWVGSTVDYSSYDYVLVMLGTNDVQSNVTAETYASNLQTIASEIEAVGARPVFAIFPMFTDTTVTGVGVNTTGYSYAARHRKALKMFCIENNYTFGDALKSFGANLAWYNDNIHPNVEGQLAVMQAWAEALGKETKNRTWFN